MDDGWVDGQAKSIKITYFENFLKTTRYFFQIVSRPLRRVFKTFSEKNLIFFCNKNLTFSSDFLDFSRSVVVVIWSIF